MSWLLSSVPLRLPATRSVGGRLRRLVWRGLAGREAAEPGPKRHPFDVRHGVDTGGLLYAPDLPTGQASDGHSEGYYATAPSLFRGAIKCWLGTLTNDQATLAAAGPAIEDYTFVDLGCGKGRVLMLASQFPFQAVRGIELHAGLARVARRNVRRWLRKPRACRKIDVACGDVLDHIAVLDRIAGPLAEDGPPAEDGPAVLFLFNSFGAAILAPLLEKLAAAARERTAPIDLVYVHPDHEVLVARMPGIEAVGWAEVPFSEEDAAADAFGVQSDCVAVFCLPGGATGA